MSRLADGAQFAHLSRLPASTELVLGREPAAIRPQLPGFSRPGSTDGVPADGAVGGAWTNLGADGSAAKRAKVSVPPIGASLGRGLATYYHWIATLVGDVP